MATETKTPTMKKTLGLTGVTVNAMALIAPGAFLWMTYQLQAATPISLAIVQLRICGGHCGRSDCGFPDGFRLC